MCRQRVGLQLNEAKFEIIPDDLTVLHCIGNIAQAVKHISCNIVLTGAPAGDTSSVNDVLNEKLTVFRH